MTLVHIGIGSNVGDSPAVVASAAKSLAALPGVHDVRVSSLYLTPPWGMLEQAPFTNAVVELSTDIGALELLDALLAIERAAGRTRGGVRWGPRTLDLDMLLYGDAVVSEPGLTVPHPHLAERAFVLLPLAELAPERVVPGLGRIGDLLARVDTGDCRRIEAPA